MKPMLLVVFGMLFIVGDTVSTYYALSKGATELNTFIRVMLDHPWLIVSLKMFLFGALSYVIMKLDEPLGRVVLITLNIAMGLVVAQNAFAMVKL